MNLFGDSGRVFPSGFLNPGPDLPNENHQESVCTSKFSFRCAEQTRLLQYVSLSLTGPGHNFSFTPEKSLIQAELQRKCSHVCGQYSPFIVAFQAVKGQREHDPDTKVFKAFFLYYLKNGK